jgi:hypothetical protein
VITARSDTMDGVMMLVIVLALLLVVRAIETGRRQAQQAPRPCTSPWRSRG